MPLPAARALLLSVLRARARTTVHVLWHGSALCGSLHGPPRGWPHRTRWIGGNDPHWPKHATCSTCREQAALLELSDTLDHVSNDLSTRRRYPLGMTPIRVRA